MGRKVLIVVASIVPIVYVLTLGKQQWDKDTAYFSCHAPVAAASSIGPSDTWGVHWPDPLTEDPAVNAIESCMFAKGYRYSQSGCSNVKYRGSGLDCFAYTWKVFLP